MKEEVLISRRQHIWQMFSWIVHSVKSGTWCIIISDNIDEGMWQQVFWRTFGQMWGRNYCMEETAFGAFHKHSNLPRNVLLKSESMLQLSQSWTMSVVLSSTWSSVSGTRFCLRLQIEPTNLKLGCLNPVALIRLGSEVSVQRNSISIVVYYFIQIIRHMFRWYDHLQAEIANNLNKIVNNYWNRVALDGNPGTY
jgi:hypothetical protein